MDTTSSTDTLAALDVITQATRRYATRAEDAADAGQNADAKLYRIRTETLTRYAAHVLQSLYAAGAIDRVERHRIDGRPQYCLSIDGWSFHSPVDEWEPDEIESAVVESSSEPRFDASPSAADDVLMPENDALRILCARFDSVNEFLVQPFVERPYRSTFAGWPSLPGAIEAGTVVSERQLCAEQLQPFLFAVGDRFETVEYGPVEIRDRYGQWLPHRHHGGGMTPRPVYDVCVDGTHRDAVREETIHDDWLVRIRDPADPCTDLDGRLGTMLDRSETSDPGFRDGDIVVIDPDCSEDGPFTYRVGPLTASWSLVLCELSPIDETGVGTVLAIEEFVDDVVAIYADQP